MGHFGTKNPRLLTGGCLQPLPDLVALVRLDILPFGGATMAWATNCASRLWGHQDPALDAMVLGVPLLVINGAAAGFMTAARVIFATHRVWVWGLVD